MLLSAGQNRFSYMSFLSFSSKTPWKNEAIVKMSQQLSDYHRRIQEPCHVEGGLLEITDYGFRELHP